MQISKTKLDGVLLLKPEVFEDFRGQYVETYNEQFCRDNGIDVKFVQDWDTAVGVATGVLNAQEAFIKGRIVLYGDQQKLLASQPVFRALDDVFNEVRLLTEYR